MKKLALLSMPLLAAVAHAAVLPITFLDYHFADGTLSYTGGNAPLIVDTNPGGWFAFSVTSQPDLWCSCEVKIQTGPLTGTDSSTWHFASGGTITVTGAFAFDYIGLDVAIPQTTILTGILGPVDLKTSGAPVTWGLAFTAPYIAVVNPEVSAFLGLPRNLLYRGTYYEDTGGPGPEVGPVSAMFGPDDAVFDLQPIPEPTSAPLFATAAIIWAVFRLKSGHRRRSPLRAQAR